MEYQLLIRIQNIAFGFCVLLGVSKFRDGSDIGLLKCSLRIAGKWHHYSKMQTEM